VCGFLAQHIFLLTILVAQTVGNQSQAHQHGAHSFFTDSTFLVFGILFYVDHLRSIENVEIEINCVVRYEKPI